MAAPRRPTATGWSVRGTPPRGSGALPPSPTTRRPRHLGRLCNRSWATGLSLANGLGSALTARHLRPAQYLGGVGLQLALRHHQPTVTLAGFDQLQGRFRAETLREPLRRRHRFAAPVSVSRFTSPPRVISFNLCRTGGRRHAVVCAELWRQDHDGDPHGTGPPRQTLAVGRHAGAPHRRMIHDYYPDRTVSAVFQSLPGASLVVNERAASRMRLWSAGLRRSSG